MGTLSCSFLKFLKSCEQKCCLVSFLFLIAFSSGCVSNEFKWYENWRDENKLQSCYNGSMRADEDLNECSRNGIDKKGRT